MLAEKAPATSILLGLVGAAFIVQVVSGQNLLDPAPEALIRTGALYGPAVFSGQVWRLFTSAFLHVGLVHLVIDGIALWLIGREIEARSRPVAMAFSFLFFAAAGSIASLIAHPTTVVAAGSSAGSLGLATALLLDIVREMDPWKARDRNVLSIILLFVLANVLLSWQVEGVDWAGHIGGFVGGLIGYPILASSTRHPILSPATFFALGAVLSIAALTVVPRQSNSFEEWARGYLERLPRLETEIVTDWRAWDSGELEREQLLARVESDHIPELRTMLARLQSDEHVRRELRAFRREEREYCVELMSALELLRDGLEREDDATLRQAVAEFGAARDRRRSIDLGRQIRSIILDDN